MCGGGLHKTMHVTLHSTHNMHTDRMLNYRHVQIHVCNYHTTQAHLQGFIYHILQAERDRNMEWRHKIVKHGVMEG